MNTLLLGALCLVLIGVLAFVGHRYQSRKRYQRRLAHTALRKTWVHSPGPQSLRAPPQLLDFSPHWLEPPPQSPVSASPHILNLLRSPRLGTRGDTRIYWSI